MKRIAVPATLPDVILQEGWERSFAYFILAKYKYKSSTIYNFSLRRLASILNISHESARFHYKKWVEQNLVRHHSNNLTLLGWNSFVPIASRSKEKNYKRKICLLVHDNLKDQICNIKSRLILKNINQQVRNYRVKREISEKLGLAKQKAIYKSEDIKAYRKAVKMAKLFRNPEIFNKGVYLSNESISRLIGNSVSFSKVLKKYMVDFGLMAFEIVKGKMVGDKMSLREFLIRKDVDHRYQDTFYWKGYAYTYPKTLITLAIGGSQDFFLPKLQVQDL